MYKKYHTRVDKNFIEVFKDTYREYYIASLEGKKKSKEEIDQRVEKTISYAENITKLYGWAQFKYNDLEQGWIDYMNWKAEKEK